MTEPEPAAGRAADPRREDDLALDPAVVERVLDAVAAQDRDAAAALVDALHPADVADLMEQIGHDERAALVRLLGDRLDPDVLSELEDDVRDDVLDVIDPEVLADAVKELDPEEVVYVVEDLEEDEKEKVLEALEPVDRAAVEQSLLFPESAAGRIMRREFVAAPPFWTVGRMIDFMRAADDLPEDFHDVILVDPAMKPVGLVRLSRIIGAQRERLLSDLTDEDMHLIGVEDEQEDVAYAFNQYHMPSAPVVDRDGRLVGVIHIEDAMEVLDEEADEDLKLLAGVGDESLSDRVWETVKGRFPWLAVNLATAILASLVIMQFDETIARIVALAVLMPIVASMGGNAATQTLTVAVRALATRDLTAANMWRVVGREALVGLVNGVLFAVLVAAVELVWYGDAWLGLVLALSMVVNLLVAGLAGALVPIGLDRAGADPALASGTFVTTVTDVVGFMTFLGLAAWILL